MHIPRQVPWICQLEWKYVQQCLHSNEPEERRAGVARVKTWRSRGKLPHAVDSTSMFVEISLRDEGEAKLLTIHELRLMYTAAFIRFFNGIVDPAQRGAFAVSVATIAERLRLPKWFVELRHAGTHEHLPSLVTLRAGCRQALLWLSENYWVASARVELATVDESHEPTKIKLRDLLKGYKDIRKSDLKEPKVGNAKTTESRPLHQTISQIVILASRRAVIREFLPEILMETGYLVPTGKNKRVRTSDLTLPLELSDLWSPLLMAFDQAWPDFTTDLIAVLVDQLDLPNSLPSLQMNTATGFSELRDMSLADKSQYLSTSYLATLAAWLRHMLLPILENDSTLGIFLKGAEVDDIMEKCLRKPNPYTQAILSMIASRDSTARPLLTPLLSYIQLSNQENETEISKLSCKTSNFDSDQHGYSELTFDTELRLVQSRADLSWNEPDAMETGADQFESRSVDMDENDDAVAGFIPEADTNGWALYPADTWKPCPIGSLPDYQSGGSVPLDFSKI